MDPRELVWTGRVVSRAVVEGNHHSRKKSLALSSTLNNFGRLYYGIHRHPPCVPIPMEWHAKSIPFCTLSIPYCCSFGARYCHKAFIDHYFLVWHKERIYMWEWWLLGIMWQASSPLNEGRVSAPDTLQTWSRSRTRSRKRASYINSSGENRMYAKSPMGFLI